MRSPSTALNAPRPLFSFPLEVAGLPSARFGVVGVAVEEPELELEPELEPGPRSRTGRRTGRRRGRRRNRIGNCQHNRCRGHRSFERRVGNNTLKMLPLSAAKRTGVVYAGFVAPVMASVPAIPLVAARVRACSHHTELRLRAGKNGLRYRLGLNGGQQGGRRPRTLPERISILRRARCSIHANIACIGGLEGNVLAAPLPVGLSKDGCPALLIRIGGSLDEVSGAKGALPNATPLVLQAVRSQGPLESMKDQ